MDDYSRNYILEEEDLEGEPPRLPNIPSTSTTTDNVEDVKEKTFLQDVKAPSFNEIWDAVSTVEGQSSGIVQDVQIIPEESLIVRKNRIECEPAINPNLMDTSASIDIDMDGEGLICDKESFDDTFSPALSVQNKVKESLLGIMNTPAKKSGVIKALDMTPDTIDTDISYYDERWNDSMSFQTAVSITPAQIHHHHQTRTPKEDESTSLDHHPTHGNKTNRNICVLHLTLVFSLLAIFASFLLFFYASDFLAFWRGKMSSFEVMNEDKDFTNNTISSTGTLTMTTNNILPEILSDSADISYTPSISTISNISSSPSTVPSQSPSSISSQSPSNGFTALTSTSKTMYPTLSEKAIEMEETMKKPDDTFVFYVMGDIPYNQKQYHHLQTQVQSLPLSYDDKENNFQFIAHVGDIMKAETSNCEKNMFTQVEELFLMNTPGMKPVFILPGDNDWSKCPSTADAWGHWIDSFFNFDQRFLPSSLNDKSLTSIHQETLSLLSQVERPYLSREDEFNIYIDEPNPNFLSPYNDTTAANFAFFKNGVLVLGVNVIATHLDTNKSEWEYRLHQTHKWCMMKIKHYWERSKKLSASSTSSSLEGKLLDAVVILGHAGPGGNGNTNHKYFFDPLLNDLKSLTYTPPGNDVNTWDFNYKKKVLYIHGNGHAWNKYKFEGLSCIQVDSGYSSDPLKVTIHLGNSEGDLFTWEK